MTDILRIDILRIDILLTDILLTESLRQTVIRQTEFREAGDTLMIVTQTRVIPIRRAAAAMTISA